MLYHSLERKNVLGIEKKIYKQDPLQKTNAILLENRIAFFVKNFILLLQTFVVSNTLEWLWQKEVNWKPQAQKFY